MLTLTVNGQSREVDVPAADDEETAGIDAEPHGAAFLEGCRKIDKPALQSGQRVDDIQREGADLHAAGGGARGRNGAFILEKVLALDENVAASAGCRVGADQAQPVREWPGAVAP